MKFKRKPLSFKIERSRAVLSRQVLMSLQRFNAHSDTARWKTIHLNNSNYRIGTSFHIIVVFFLHFLFINVLINHRSLSCEVLHLKRYRVLFSSGRLFLLILCCSPHWIDCPLGSNSQVIGMCSFHIKLSNALLL